MSGLDKNIKAGLGPYGPVVAVSSSSTLGLTVAKIDLPSIPNGQEDVYQFRLVNGSSLNDLAYLWVRKGSAAPSFTADFSASCGVVVMAGKEDTFKLLSSSELYLVGSGAGTRFNLRISKVSDS